MKVKLNKKAESFYDMTTGLQVLPGEVIELTKKQAASKYFKTRLNGGHLVEVADIDEKEEVEETDGEDEKTLHEILSDIKSKKEIIEYLTDHAEELEISEAYLAQLSDMKRQEILAEFEEEDETEE